MNVSPKKNLLQSLILCLLAVVALPARAQQPASSMPPPTPDAIPFQTDELTVNKGIVQRVEFTRTKMNLTLKNATSSRQNVDVHVYVLNKDGVVIFAQHEKWILDTLDVDAKFAKDYNFLPEMPESLQFSIYVKSFDLTPKWILIR